MLKKRALFYFLAYCNAYAVASPIVITASDLYQEYDKNEIRADKKYKGKRLSVTGVIESIESDVFDEPQVNLSGGRFFSLVAAEFKKSAQNKVIELEKGQSIKLLCVGGGEIMGFPLLKECEFYNGVESIKVQPTHQKSQSSYSSEQLVHNQLIYPQPTLEKDFSQTEERSFSQPYLDFSKLNFQEGVAYFQDEHGLYGFVNGYGNVVITPKYKGAGGFYHGRAVVKDQVLGLWGYIDKNARWIVHPQFCMAGRFSEGLAAVYLGGSLQNGECVGGKWGFIDPSGSMVIQPKYERVWAFSKVNGIPLAKFEHGEYSGYINKKGEWVK